jgi:hypothetical protein
MMAVLFDCSIDNIALHLKNIFKTKQLDENSVAEDFSVTALDWKKMSEPKFQDTKTKKK